MQTNYELQRLNTLALPAKAKVFARFASQMELLGLLDKAKENNISVYVLGEGSNVLLANDIDGLVLQSAMEGVKLLRSEEHTFELQSRPHLVCRLLLEKKNTNVY